MGTILLVVMHFGWGRPVPVDTRYLRNPRRDLLVIAAAGPAVNLAMAVVFGLGMRTVDHWLLTSETGVFVYLGLQALVLLSLLLAFFNLLPVPPLDGSKVLMGLLPVPLADAYARQASRLSWGLIVVGAMTGWHPLSRLIYPPARWIYVLLTGTDMP